MAKRKAPPKAEIPEWVVTYGDLMSLLLCFFILLAAFSELKQERDFQDVIKSIQDAFGYTGGIGKTPSRQTPSNSTINSLEDILKLSNEERAEADTNVRSITGREQTITDIHEGERQPIQGQIAFEPSSFELSTDSKTLLRDKVAPMIRDRNYIVLVRGHAWGNDDLKSGLGLLDLSFERAKAVQEYLVDECNVSGKILRAVATGDTEPLESARDSLGPSVQNRRVEIIVTEVPIDQMHPDAFGTGRQ